jgi:hypothetical protein
MRLAVAIDNIIGDEITIILKMLSPAAESSGK